MTNEPEKKRRKYLFFLMFPIALILFFLLWRFVTGDIQNPAGPTPSATSNPTNKPSVEGIKTEEKDDESLTALIENNSDIKIKCLGPDGKFSFASQKDCDNVNEFWKNHQPTTDAGNPSLPSSTPSPTPTPTPEAEPTQSPNSTPTPESTVEPTATPTESPIPTVEPTATPSPTPEPTVEPTSTPSESPSPTPTAEPTIEPTVEPTATPTATPTESPTPTPTVEPTPEPTATPTMNPVNWRTENFSLTADDFYMTIDGQDVSLASYEGLGIYEYEFLDSRVDLGVIWSVGDIKYTLHIYSANDGSTTWTDRIVTHIQNVPYFSTILNPTVSYPDSIYDSSTRLFETNLGTTFNDNVDMTGGVNNDFTGSLHFTNMQFDKFSPTSDAIPQIDSFEIMPCSSSSCGSTITFKLHGSNLAATADYTMHINDTGEPWYGTNTSSVNDPYDAIIVGGDFPNSVILDFHNSPLQECQGINFFSYDPTTGYGSNATNIEYYDPNGTCN